MGKGAPTGRADHRFDHLVVAAVDKGYGVELRYQGIGDFERANDIRKGIYRCGRHRGLAVEAGSGREADAGEMGIHKMANGEWEVRYRIHDKKSARKRHIEKYGTDRSKWPYDPRRKATTEEREALSAHKRNELGQKVNH
jgi:hypothetical protein